MSDLTVIVEPDGQGALPDVLRPEDRERRRALFADGTAPNTLRGYRSDRAYWEAWHAATVGTPLPLAAGQAVSVAVVERFILDHVEGLDPRVEAALLAAGIKRKPGPHRLATVERRLACLAAMHRMLDLPPPTLSAPIRELLKVTRRALARRGVTPKKARAATRDEVLLPLLAVSTGNATEDLRDRALLLVGWASGGRRRSEIVALRIEDLEAVGDDYVLTLGVRKARQDGARKAFPVRGRAAAALRAWLAVLAEEGIVDGPLFRKVSKRGRVVTIRGADGEPRPLSDRTVARIVQERARLAGLDPAGLSAHSLRAGFLTQAGRDGVPLQEAMALSDHRSLSVAAGYYEAGDALRNRAGDLLG
ncbi:tyrosine-type recombinase/integrase [Azospirillum sp.]|uniref:tyrosine-type recombinase/integrase n=1 Tax=Azospirillum sp. TaxID=34012 RepID=UPI003D75D547